MVFLNTDLTFGFFFNSLMFVFVCACFVGIYAFAKYHDYKLKKERNILFKQYLEQIKLNKPC